MNADPILQVRGVDAGYHGRAVVRNVDLSIASGEVLALLGPNGAGKTTLLLTIAGFLAPLKGTIVLDGHPVTARRPERNTRRGLVLVPDSRELILGLSVADNLRLARRRSGAELEEILTLFPTLRVRLNTKAGSLSGGEQQMLAVGRALIQRPKVMLLDEMSMGLGPIVRDELMDRVRRTANERGVAAILVEQHVDEVLRRADRALVLVHGETRLSASAAELLDDRTRLEHAYLSA